MGKGKSRALAARLDVLALALRELARALGEQREGLDAF